MTSLAFGVLVLVCTPAQAPLSTNTALGHALCRPAASPFAEDVRARTDEALAFLSEAGMLPAHPPVIALDALQGNSARYVRALAVSDAAAAGLAPEWHARPAVLLEGDGERSTARDPDVVLHELVHLWLESIGVPSRRTIHPSEHFPDLVVVDVTATIIHEAVADFVAAARRKSAVLGRASAVAGSPPRSLRSPATCPDAWSGAPHDDSRVISAALWETARHDAVGLDRLVAALQASASSWNGTRGTPTLARFVSAVWEALATDSPEAASAWQRTSKRRGLDWCTAPIALTIGRRRASQGDAFRLPGIPRELTGPPNDAPMVAGTPVFQVTVPVDAAALTISMRVAQSAHVSVAWQARDGRNGSLASGLVRLEGAPIARARLAPPEGTHSVLLTVVNHAAAPTEYDGLLVTPAP